MEIRFAEVDDARGIASVTVRAWRAAYRGIVPDEVLDGLSVDERETVVRNMLTDTGGATFTLVALGGGRIHGHCTIAAPGRDEDAGEVTAEVGATYVDPDRWREGTGAALLRRAWTELRSRGEWQEVTLWVLRENEAGRSFYETFGFQPDGAATTHERSGQEIIRMRATLRRP